MLNRNALQTRIAELAQQAAILREPVALIVGDLDNFKAINDGHGHAAGDAVLKDVAYRMRKALRAYDLAYRLGGEEFLIVLPGADGRQAAEVAEALRGAIGGDPIAGPARHDLLRRQRLGAGRVRVRRRSSPRPTSRCTAPSRRGATACASTRRTSAPRLGDHQRAAARRLGVAGVSSISSRWSGRRAACAGRPAARAARRRRPRAASPAACARRARARRRAPR